MAWSDAAREAAQAARRRHIGKWADAAKKKFGLRNLDIYAKNDVLTLAMIRAHKASQGTGGGSNAMLRLTQQADKSGMRIALTPGHVGSGQFTNAKRARLIAFYKRFGFVKNTDQSISESMLRLPKGK